MNLFVLVNMMINAVLVLRLERWPVFLTAIYVTVVNSNVKDILMCV